MGAFAATSPTTQDSALLPKIGQPYVIELKKPEYGVSRCMLTPVFASDSMTVALSTDRIFAAGDIFVAVGGEAIDSTAKFPVRDALMKRASDESIPIRIRRASKEIAVTAKCTDAKVFYDLLLEAAFAAANNDAAGCADKMRAAAGLHALNFYPMHLAFQCGRLAGRIVGPTDQAKAYYEVYEQLIRESQWSVDALNRNRSTILTAVDALRKGNAVLLADDLKQQFDQALSAKTQTTASLVEGR
jgi:hypothetical protein